MVSAARFSCKRRRGRAVPRTGAASVAAVATRSMHCPSRSSGGGGPDLFIPAFVGIALGGYGLILVLDAIQNGLCIAGTCWGTARPTEEHTSLSYLFWNKQKIESMLKRCECDREVSNKFQSSCR